MPNANVLNPEPESITLNSELETITLDPATEPDSLPRTDQPLRESTSNTANTAEVVPALDADAPTEPVAMAEPLVETAKAEATTESAPTTEEPTQVSAEAKTKIDS